MVIRSDHTENHDEALSEWELDLLRGFLSLSALTNSTGGGGKSLAGAFPHKAAMLEFLERTLKPKYQATLASMNTSFQSDFGEHNGAIGFDYRLGAFAFGLWIGWNDSEGTMSSYLCEVSGADKNIVRHWFRSNASAAFPNMQFRHLRSSQYAFLETRTFEDVSQTDSEQQRLNDYLSLAQQTLDSLIPLLVELHQQKVQHVARLIEFADKLCDRFAMVFPPEEGWRVENQFRNLWKYGGVCVRRQDWAGDMALSLEAEDSFGTNFLLGVGGVTKDIVQSAGVRESVFYACKKIFATEEAIETISWPYAHWLPVELRYSNVGWFPNHSWSYKWEDPAEEDHVLTQIVERFARFKDILPELDDLSAAIKQP